MAYLYWIRRSSHTDMMTEGYIGVTSKTTQRRFLQHACGKAANRRLGASLSKYDDIVVTTLAQGEMEYVLDLEKKLRPDEFIGWNMAVGGQRNRFGVNQPEDSVKRAADKLRGIPRSDEVKRKVSESLMGHSVSQETRDKISRTKKGSVVHTEEWKEKLSKSMSGEGNPMAGKSGRLNPSAKLWDVYNLDGELLAESVYLSDWCNGDKAYIKGLSRTNRSCKKPVRQFRGLYIRDKEVRHG